MSNVACDEAFKTLLGTEYQRFLLFWMKISPPPLGPESWFILVCENALTLIKLQEYNMLSFFKNLETIDRR